MQDLNGKVAFITGAASGLGLGMAQAFFQQGMRLVLADIDRDELQRVVGQFGDNAIALQMDVTDRAAWQQAKLTVLERFDAVDVLCNNAGIGPDGREFADMEPDSFDRIIRINLTSVFNGISTFAADMRARGSGHIVNTASMAGLVATARLGGYTAAKFAVVGLSEVLRAELVPAGVGVTVFCPGLVRTRLAETTRAAGSEVPQASMEGGIEPLEAAQVLVRAIKENSLYAISHPGYRPGVVARIDTLLDAFK